MMKAYILILQLLLIGICCAQVPQSTPQRIALKLPDSIEKVLLRKTGTKSILAVRELAYRQCDKFEILAAVLELENYPDLKVGVIEGIMHVSVVFVTEKDGSVKMYKTDERIQTVVYAKEVDIKRLIILF